MDDFDHELMREYTNKYVPLVGQSYTFEDKDSIQIVQIKRRDDGPWVTFHVQQGPGIPRKLVMRIDEFSQTYGHLFGIDD